MGCGEAGRRLGVRRPLPARPVRSRPSSARLSWG